MASRFDLLHELIYRRGGIKPVNAAIDELCKLLLVRVHAVRHPDTRFDGVPIGAVLDPARIRIEGDVAIARLRAAFDQANAHPDYQWRRNGADGFFIQGDTLRLTDVQVTAEASALVSSIPVGSEMRSPRAGIGEEDTIGLAFEVFLRGRYQHGGGLGTYLTPE